MENQEIWPRTTFTHRACFGAGCTAVLFSIAKSIVVIAAAPRSGRPWVESAVAAVVAYLAADLGTGIYHWAVDNYGSAQTPILGPQIVGFLGHHLRPSHITKTDVAYNVHMAAAAVAAVATPINILCGDAVVLSFVGVFGGCVMLSQQFHAWSHTPKGKLPTVVAALQSAGIILGRSEHALHHRPPFNGNYCIVSGLSNRILDKSNFFLALELAIAALLGHQPRSWTDPAAAGYIFA